MYNYILNIYVHVVVSLVILLLEFFYEKESSACSEDMQFRLSSYSIFPLQESNLSESALIGRED